MDIYSILPPRRSGGRDAQVSHGLNLALKLRDGYRLPLLLLDITVAQPKIRQALEELSFVHFARFVPSWDGTALMVTTEFDGLLEPYVMDFVIALGDVFNTLLSYVEDPPPLPIQDNPDAFWRYVLQWNRVPFLPRAIAGDLGLFPPNYDYPLYSAYPGKTVADIAGARVARPPPAIDHPADPVDLADVQGNILSGYRAEVALHLFLTVVDSNAARHWLAHTLPQTDGEARPAWGGIMSAVRWKQDGAKLVKPPFMTNVGFTYRGLEVLLPGRINDGLDRFPKAFRQGAQARAPANGDVGPSAPDRWLFGRDEQEIHIVLSLYASTPETAGACADIDGPAAHIEGDVRSTLLDVGQLLSNSAEGNGLNILMVQRCDAIADRREHFGYRDGISKPRISGQCKPDDADFQPSASPGEFLLGRHYKSIFGGASLGDLPEDLATNGTFGALRLLEQHVAVLDQTVSSEAQRLQMSEPALRARLLGRWPDGAPLALERLQPGVPSNDFDYAPSWEHPGVLNDHGGERCPVGAHIRRTNPRTARVAGQRHSRRLIRRGMPTTWKDEDGDKVGLFGLFIGASLERQFEFIQQQWIQGDLAASGIRGSQDPIAGIRTGTTCLAMPGIGELNVPPLVTTRGSLYLFFPGLATLRGLDVAAGRSDFSIFVDDAKRFERADTRMPESATPDCFPPAAHQAFGEDSLIGTVTALSCLDLNAEIVTSLLTSFRRQARSTFALASPPLLPPAGFDPLDPTFVADPFPVFATLRAQHRRIVWVEAHQAYWVLGVDDTRAMFTNLDDFRQQPSSQTTRGIITLDGPRHDVVRGVVASALTASTARLSDYIDEATASAFDRLDRLHAFDFMAEYGLPVPRAVFWRIFGIEASKSAEFDRQAQTMMRHFAQPERPGASDSTVFADAALRLSAKLGVVLFTAMAKPSLGGTLIAEIARRTQPSLEPVPPVLGRTIGFKEALMTLVQVVLAGMSTHFLLGTAMRNLLLPDARAGRAGETPWACLFDLSTRNPTAFEAALRGALDEARRVDPPVTIVQRYAARALEVAGVRVPADCPVFAVVASANRDEAGGADLETFQWDRYPSLSHLSLGSGVHECVGKALQNSLVPALLTAVIRRYPELRLGDTTAVPAWLDNVYFRVLLSLPVTRCPHAAPCTEPEAAPPEDIAQG